MPSRSCIHPFRFADACLKPWERGLVRIVDLGIGEGPDILRCCGKIRIIYSAVSWKSS
jgi:hypothetical protein